MARPKKADEDKAVKVNVSMPPEDFKKLCSYCQRNIFQPSISQVIRLALDDFYKNHPNS